MARLFPLRSETTPREGAPRVVDLDGEDADAVFSALSSGTARRIYATLDEKPGTPSDVADAIDSSIQNVRYHLEKLEEAGLVEVVDTWYSSRGNEMSVYATANGPLIVTSDQSRAAQLKEALARFVGAVGVLAGASLLVQAASEPFGLSMGGEDADAEATGFAEDDAEPEVTGDDATEDQEDVTYDSQEGVETTFADDVTGVLDAFTDTTADVLAGLSPGLAFFLGGLTMLVVAGIWWYWTAYRPENL